MVVVVMVFMVWLGFSQWWSWFGFLGVSHGGCEGEDDENYVTKCH